MLCGIKDRVVSYYSNPTNGNEQLKPKHSVGRAYAASVTVTSSIKRRVVCINLVECVVVFGPAGEGIAVDQTEAVAVEKKIVAGAE